MDKTIREFIRAEAEKIARLDSMVQKFPNPHQRARAAYRFVMENYKTDKRGYED